MNDIAPIGRPNAAATDGVRRQVRPQPTAPPAGRGVDQVEFSAAARYLSRVQQLPDVRQDLVDRVRAEIEAGTYETPEKLEAALAPLLEDLQG